MRPPYLQQSKSEIFIIRQFLFLSSSDNLQSWLEFRNFLITTVKERLNWWSDLATFAFAFLRLGCICKVWISSLWESAVLHGFDFDFITLRLRQILKWDLKSTNFITLRLRQICEIWKVRISSLWDYNRERVLMVGR